MLDWQTHRKSRLCIKTICIVLIVCFLSYDFSWAGATEVLSFNNLASLSHSPFVPPTLKYLSVNEANPHNYFNFLLDKGRLSVTDRSTLNKEARQLINFFFLGVTLPDDVFWVNLKPAESEHITSEQLSHTDLGRTLLEQDFRLKCDVSQYLNPQNPIGRQFWEKLYTTLGKDEVKKASITTSNRVWIVPAEAVVVETEDGALLAKSSLKVLLESEYAALKLKPNTQPLSESSSGNSDSLQAITEQLMKEIVIPAITKDVNESQNYAPLRQIYHSLILAQWFKRRHKDANSAYAQAINKGYLNGLESQVPWEKQQIWQDYLKSYKQGEYKIQDTIFGLKRMYFSGGVIFDLGAASFPLTIITQKELPEVLNKDHDLLNSDSLKDSLVVITERQGNRENLEEQPLVQDIKIVSSVSDSPKEAVFQQPEKEKENLQESPQAVEASSPAGINLKDKLKKIIIMTAFLSVILFSHIQPAFAHYFTQGPQGKPQAIVEVWNKKTPAEDTLGGIGRDILIAEGKKVTPQALYGSGGKVEQLAQANRIPNPNLIHPNQKIDLPSLSTQAQEKIIPGAKTEQIKPTPITPEQPAQPPITTPKAHFNLIDWIINNPLIAVGVFAGIALLGTILIFIRRHRKATGEKEIDNLLGSLENDIKKAEKTLDESNAKIEDAQQELKNIKEQGEAAQKELDKLKDEKEKAAKAMADELQKKQALEKEIESLYRKQEMLKEEIGYTQKEYSEAKESLDRLLQEIKDLKDKKSLAAIEEIQDLKQQRDILIKEIEGLRNEKKELEELIESLKAITPKPEEPVVAPPEIKAVEKEAELKDIEAISKARQEYTDIALEFQGVQTIAERNVFVELCERLNVLTTALDKGILSEVTSEREKASQEQQNANNRLIEAAEITRRAIASEIALLSYLQLDNSADFEKKLSQLQALFPEEIFSEFTETINKIRELVVQKEKAVEEEKLIAAVIADNLTVKYQTLIEAITNELSFEKLKDLRAELERLNRESAQKPETLKVIAPLQKETNEALSKKEKELKLVLKPLYKRINLSTLWQVFRRYFVFPWWLGRQLNNALNFQGLAQKVRQVYNQYRTVFDWFKGQEFYKAFQRKAENIGLSQEFDKPGIVSEFKVDGDRSTYRLQLSDRSPEYLIRGYFSGDCTNPAFPFAHTSFQTATLNHLVMPGFFNFKVLRGGRWIGNIYAAVIDDNGKPVLLVDAIQIPWRVWGGLFLQPNGAYAPFWLPFKLFPIWTFKKAIKVSDAALKGLQDYAREAGFSEIWLSQFVSNFYDFKEYYNSIIKKESYKESPAISTNMIMGWPELQKALQLSTPYVESLNRSAWKIWTKEEVRAQIITPEEKVARPAAVAQTPEQLIQGISEGKNISLDTQKLLKETFGITTSYLSEALSQRLKESAKFNKVLEILGSGVTISSWMKHNKRESGYDEFERQIKELGINPEFDKPGLTIPFGVEKDKRSYLLSLSNRDTDDIARGYVSADCTNPSWAYAQHTFNKYTPEHLLSPGFLNFKVFRSDMHGPPKWIGNVYVAVLRQNNLGVLLIDAIQIPWKGLEERFGMQILPLPPPYSGRNPKLPFSVENLNEAETISEAIIAELAYKYAYQYGFKKTYLAFGSNFTPLVERIYKNHYSEFNRLLPPSNIVATGGGEQGPALKIPKDLKLIPDSQYLKERNALNMRLVGAREEVLDSFNNKRGFAEITTAKRYSNETKLFSFTFPIDPVFGYVALAGWLIYLGYRVIKWLVNRPQRQADIEPVVETSYLATPEQVQISKSLGDFALEKRPSGMLLMLTEQERANIQLRFGSFLDRVIQGSVSTWPKTFIQAFETGKLKPLWELPLPVPVSRIRKESSPRGQAIMILRVLKIWMDGGDARVVRDLRTGIESARDAVTEEALENLSTISDERLIELLTSDYERRFSKEINKNIKVFLEHIRRFQGPSPEERGLYVEPRIQARYERFPRYLKWLFTQNPGLDDDPEIQHLMGIIHEQMMRLPSFASEIEEFAKSAFSESIKLNPELALRIFEYATGGEFTREDMLERLKTYQLKEPPVREVLNLDRQKPQEQKVALLPDNSKASVFNKEKENLIESLSKTFEENKAKIAQQRIVLRVKEKDLSQLKEAYQDAKASSENYTADVLMFAIEGTEGEVNRLKEEISALEGKEQEYQKEIKGLREQPKSKGTNFYATSFDFFGILFAYSQVKEFLISYGYPNSDYLVITLLILSPWIISSTYRFLVRNVFRSNAEPIKLHDLFLSRGVLWSIFAFPFIFIGHIPFIIRPWSKMGRLGLYSYWEKKNPRYYRILKEEMQGLAEDFRKPGEKFRVAYDRKNVDIEPKLMTDPIKDELSAVREFLREINESQPQFYKKLKNVIYGKRPVPEYRELFETVSKKDVKEILTELLSRIQSWNMPVEEKFELILKAYELFFAAQTGDLRKRIHRSKDLPKKAKMNAEYWQRLLSLVNGAELISKSSKLSNETVNIINKKISMFLDQTGKPRQGLLQFYLSGVTFTDFFSTTISKDCTWSHFFFPFLGTKLDPAFMLFKVVEDGRWVGNLYTMVLKDSEGNECFLLDSFQLRIEPDHPFLNKNDGQFKDTINAFMERLKFYLAQKGFKALLVAPTPSSRSKINSAINEFARKQGTSISGSFKKPAGMLHRRLSSNEYIQALNHIHSENVSFSGTKIKLVEPLQEIERKKREEELKKLKESLNKHQAEFGKYSEETNNLKTQLENKRFLSQQLEASLQREREKDREAAVKAISLEIEKVYVEIGGLEKKHSEINSKGQELNKKVQELKTAVMSLSDTNKVSVAVKLSIYAFLINGILFSVAKETLASSFVNQFSSILPLTLIFVPFVFGWIGLYLGYKTIKKWLSFRSGEYVDIAGLIKALYKDESNKQLKDRRVILSPRTKEQIAFIEDIASNLDLLVHPETEDINNLSFNLVNRIKQAELDENTEKSLLVAVSHYLSWAKQRQKFLRNLHFIKSNTSVNQRRLFKLLSDYLSIPSESGKEVALRDYIVKQLKAFGGAEYEMVESVPQARHIPKNLIWDIPASSDYKGEPLRIAMHAHLDTTTHTPTLLQFEDENLIAEGKGTNAEAGLDDAAALAVIMEMLSIIKEKQIPHPALRIIFTAEEEPNPQGAIAGARYLVIEHPEVFEDIDLLVSVDGPLLDKQSPLAAKFINFGEKKEKEQDPCYKIVVDAARRISANENLPKEFDFSAGDEQEFSRIEGLRIAHFRANYSQGHSEIDSIESEHLILLTDWVREIITTLDKKPFPQPKRKDVAKDLLLKSFPVLSREYIQQGITQVISNSGKLTPGMEFFIYEEAPQKRLLQFKHTSLGRLELLSYKSGYRPERYEVMIDDESIFDAEGNILIMDLLNSKSTFVIDRNKREFALSNLLKDYSIPKHFNPEVGGVVVKDPSGLGSARVVEFPYKGFVQLQAISKGASRFLARKQLVPFVHLEVKINMDSLGRFKGIELPCLYDILKERFSLEGIILGFHTHPDDFSSKPHFSHLDLQELDRQKEPLIFNLELVIGKRGYSFLHHFKDNETKQIKEISLNEVKIIRSSGMPEEKIASFLRGFNALPRFLSPERFYPSKGKGMFGYYPSLQIEQVIREAKEQGRGYLIWGNLNDWQDAREEYIPEIRSIIGYIRKYPHINITGLGSVDIANVLSQANIILIHPKNESGGLVVNNENSYQVAFNDISDNSIKIDALTYERLSSNYSEKVALLSHEAIELGAQRLCRERNIPWTVNLAKEIDRIAEDFEIQVAGRSLRGRGSRLDERITEILRFTNAFSRTEVNPVRTNFQQDDSVKATRVLTLERQEDSKKVLDNLRDLLEGMSRKTAANLPARLENFPTPIAHEIKKAYLFRKVKGVPIDIDYLSALSLFFARLFPNHINNLLKYVSNLYIYMVDNKRSTFGATLRGNTLYIQRSCIQDLIGRPISVKGIYKAIEDKDPEVGVALFRVIVHEVGGAFFKLSHESNQALEKLFLSMLSKEKMHLSTNTESEIDKINSSQNLDSVARMDWAAATFIPDSSTEDISINEFDKLPAVFMKQAIPELDNALLSSELKQKASSPDKADAAVNPGGIDLSNIEITLKDEKFVSSLNSADLKILRAARALKEGQNSLAVLYVQEVRLILKDNILSENDITQRDLLQNLLVQLEQKELLNPEAVEFYHAFQGQEIFAGEILASKQ